MCGAPLRAGLQDAERGAIDVDYADLDGATYEAALTENRAVFHGWPDAGITGIVETTERGGYPLRRHLSEILDGGVVWAPGLDGAVVLSKRGGDFVLDVGQDFAIGYRGLTGKRAAHPRLVGPRCRRPSLPGDAAISTTVCTPQEVIGRMVPH